MKFWDSSAIVPLLLREASTQILRSLSRADPRMVVWTLSDVEFRSAVCRLRREGGVSAAVADAATAEFDAIWSGATVVSAVDPVKERAKRLLGVHPLRAADALQLAAALVASNESPVGFNFVTLDVRLADAARREGFRVHP